MNYKYYYNGEPLVEYCKKNPKYKYNQITKYISIKHQEDPSRPISEIIEDYFNKHHRTNTRYIINGMNLSKYCKAMNISYFAIAKDINESKKNPKYNNMSEDEIIDMVLSKHIVGDVQMLDFMNEEPKKLSLRPDDN